jgi:hypothetical protein
LICSWPGSSPGFSKTGSIRTRPSIPHPGTLDTFVRELKRVSPRSRIVVLDFFETFEY